MKRLRLHRGAAAVGGAAFLFFLAKGIIWLVIIVAGIRTVT